MTLICDQDLFNICVALCVFFYLYRNCYQAHVAQAHINTFKAIKMKVIIICTRAYRNQIRLKSVGSRYYGDNAKTFFIPGLND